MPRPVRSAYSIPYGAQYGAIRANGARRHNGTDYHAPPGTPIYGVANGGRVAHIGYNGDPWLGLGHNITIVYPGGVQTLDAHMISRTPLAYGQTVNANTLVGYVGNTGNAVNASPRGPYNGNHLHHERRHNGVLVDPEAIYRTEPAGGGSTPIEKDEDMTTYELWRSSPTDMTVWFVVDRLFRYGIPSELALSDYTFFIRSKGQDATIRVGSMPSLGLPVYKDGVTVYNPLTAAQVKSAVPTAKQIADAVVAALPKAGGSSITSEQITEAVKAALTGVEVTADVPTADEIAAAVRAAIIKD